MAYKYHCHGPKERDNLLHRCHQCNCRPGKSWSKCSTNHRCDCDPCLNDYQWRGSTLWQTRKFHSSTEPFVQTCDRHHSGRISPSQFHHWCPAMFYHHASLCTGQDQAWPDMLAQKGCVPKWTPWFLLVLPNILLQSSLSPRFDLDPLSWRIYIAWLRIPLFHSVL